MLNNIGTEFNIISTFQLCKVLNFELEILTKKKYAHYR
jgi:hypothetical protein